MGRTTFVQDRNTGEIIEIDRAALARRRAERPRGPYIMTDIRPYRSVIDGSMITSRSQHREHLARHGCHEVGNEEPAPLREWHYAQKHGEQYAPGPPAIEPEPEIDTSDVLEGVYVPD